MWFNELKAAIKIRAVSGETNAAPIKTTTLILNNAQSTNNKQQTR